MKAKITYTVDIKDIPDEVKRLLKNCHSKLELTSLHLDRSSEQVSDERLSSTIEDIESIRLSLSEIDLTLEDCYSILYGLRESKTNDLEKIQETTEEVSQKLNTLKKDVGHLLDNDGKN